MNSQCVRVKFGTAVYLTPLRLIEDSENLVRFGLDLLPVDAHGPNQFGVVAVELNLNVFSDGSPATAAVTGWATELLRKFAFTVHHRKTPVGEFEGERCAVNLKGPSDRRVVVNSRVDVAVLVVLAVNNLYGQRLSVRTKTECDEER